DRVGEGGGAAGLLGEAVDLPRTQPRAFADLLGREERLEHVRQNVGRDAAAGIGHMDSDELATEPLLCGLAFEHHRLGGDAERPPRPPGPPGTGPQVWAGEARL